MPEIADFSGGLWMILRSPHGDAQESAIAPDPYHG
jgi:hypothetical protein